MTGVVSSTINERLRTTPERRTGRKRQHSRRMFQIETWSRRAVKTAGSWPGQVDVLDDQQLQISNWHDNRWIRASAMRSPLVDHRLDLLSIPCISSNPPCKRTQAQYQPPISGRSSDRIVSVLGAPDSARRKMIPIAQYDRPLIQ